MKYNRSVNSLSGANGLVDSAGIFANIFNKSVGGYAKNLRDRELLEAQKKRQDVADSRATTLFNQSQEKRAEDAANREYSKNYNYETQGNTADIHGGARDNFADLFGKDLENVQAKATQEAKSRNLGKQATADHIANRLKGLNEGIIAGAKDKSTKLKSTVFGTVYDDVLKATGDRTLATSIATSESSGYSSAKDLMAQEAADNKEYKENVKAQIDHNNKIVDTFEKFNLSGQKVANTNANKTLSVTKSSKSKKPFVYKDSTKFREWADNNGGWNMIGNNDYEAVLSLLKGTGVSEDFAKQAVMDTFDGDQIHAEEHRDVANDAIAAHNAWYSKKGSTGSNKITTSRKGLGTDTGTGIKNVISDEAYITAKKNLELLNQPVRKRSLFDLMSGAGSYSRQTTDSGEPVEFVEAPTRSVASNRTNINVPRSRLESRNLSALPQEDKLNLIGDRGVKENRQVRVPPKEFIAPSILPTETREELQQKFKDGTLSAEGFGELTKLRKLEAARAYNSDAGATRRWLGNLFKEDNSDNTINTARLPEEAKFNMRRWLMGLEQ